MIDNAPLELFHKGSGIEKACDWRAGLRAMFSPRRLGRLEVRCAATEKAKASLASQPESPAFDLPAGWPRSLAAQRAEDQKLGMLRRELARTSKLSRGGLAWPPEGLQAMPAQGGLPEALQGEAGRAEPALLGSQGPGCFLQTLAKKPLAAWPA